MFWPCVVAGEEYGPTDAISEVVHIANTAVLNLILRHVARLFDYCTLEALMSTTGSTLLSREYPSGLLDQILSGDNKLICGDARSIEITTTT